MSTDKPENNLLEKVVSLCKRRGFVFPGSEIYGGLANSWDYGPMGVELKNNIKNLWWRKFVHQRDDLVGLDAALIMNPKVWEASGHVATFKDPLVECKNCHERFRADKIDLKAPCPSCDKIGTFTEIKHFSQMLKTFLGSVEDSAALAYLRPETAQAMFVDFKNVLDSTRVSLPFGIAQIGKAFRNEITPGNFIFRTREFEQMEIEYFVKEVDWEKSFEHWRKEMWSWMTDILGLHKDHIHELDVPDGERAHYSKRTIDFEFDYPFGRDELYGLAYRTDFDLKNHFKEAPYRDPETNETFYPHVIEPSLGVDRSLLAVLLNAYTEDGERIVMKFKPALAPYKAAVFPLLKNKHELVAKAKEVYLQLVTSHYPLTPISWDDRGNIGKRYYAQDEIGTPHCITVDFQTLEDDTVTIRDRDTATQKRVAISELEDLITQSLKG